MTLPAVLPTTVDAAKAFIMQNIANNTPLSVAELQTVAENIQWSVPSNLRVLTYSDKLKNALTELGGQPLQAFQAAYALQDATPGTFFTDRDTGTGQLLQSREFDTGLKAAGITSKAEIKAAKQPAWTTAPHYL